MFSPYAPHPVCDRPLPLSRARDSVRAFLNFEREFINVHVARRDVAPGGRDTDDGLLEIFLREADGIKHGAGGGAFRSVNQHT